MEQIRYPAPKGKPAGKGSLHICLFKLALAHLQRFGQAFYF
jgi:hypothetical protein